MAHYRRNYVPGGSFFFTVTLGDHRSRLLIEHIDQLRQAYRRIQRATPLVIEAVGVLPDHLHAIWTGLAPPV